MIIRQLQASLDFAFARHLSKYGAGVSLLASRASGMMPTYVLR